MNGLRIVLYGTLALLVAYMLYLIVEGESVTLPDTRMPFSTQSFPGVSADKVYRLAYAMATQEGFWVQGSIPHRANNPLDLALGDKGLGTIGTAKITVFPPDTVAGWEAAYKQAYLILSGKSEYYGPDMSLSQIAAIYTTTQQAEWANNIASLLGTSPDAPLGDWLNA